MGIQEFISKFKTKTIDKATEDYIPVEKINANVQTYGSTSARERLADIKSKVKNFQAKKKFEAAEKAELERVSLKQELSDLKLKNAVAKERAKLPPTGLKAALQKFETATGREIPKPQPGKKKILNDNIFGGRGPFEP